VDVRAGQLVRLHADDIVVLVRGRAQGGEAHQVIVDQTRAQVEVASAGGRDFRFAETPQQNAQKIIRSPHMLGGLLVYGIAGYVACVDFKCGGVDTCTDRAKAFNGFAQIGHVFDFGQVVDSANTVGGQRRRYDRDGRVLRAADPHLAGKGFLSHHDLLHA
jgi:hypothetical protein